MIRWQKPIAVYGILVIAAMFLHPQRCAAQQHVVSLEDIGKQLEVRSESAARDRADIERILSLPAARAALAKSQIGTEQVKTAVAMLAPEELSRMAAQARLAEKDVEGGFLVGILALIGLVVVILVVIAVVNE